MQLRIALVRALLPYLVANHFFIPVPSYRTDEVAFRPKLATPQTLFDGRNTMKDFAGRQTFNDLDNLRRTVARNRLHQKMDVVFVGPHFEKDDFVPLGDV